MREAIDAAGEDTAIEIIAVPCRDYEHARAAKMAFDEHGGDAGE
jgi:hypothetical protein